jgi:hypothetical protein
MSTQDIFDNPENIEILDRFIKSIKFLGVTMLLKATRLPNLINKSIFGCASLSIISVLVIAVSLSVNWDLQSGVVHCVSP